jgi:endo-1,4-beta-xylanase
MFQIIFSKIMCFFLSLIFFFSGTSMASYNYSDKLNSTDYEGLKSVYSGYFDIGAAIAPSALEDENSVNTILKNYSSLTAENAFKLPVIHPSEDVWNFAPADAIANFAREHGLKLRGHVLVWGSQQNWMLYDKDGNFVDKEVFYQRLYEYFKTMMGRYGDVVRTWDVVNEPFNYERGCAFKNTEIYKLCGEEYITKAFEMAHKIDPTATLVLNETRILNNDVKMKYLLEYVQKYLDEGVPINAIGLQSHYDTLTVKESAKRLDKLINKISDMGLDVQITEMDMTYYSTDLVAFHEKPEWIETLQIKKYKEMFEVLRKNADKISSVTFWGLNDGVSYCNVGNPKRTDWPLLFDENNRPKQAFYAICDFQHS